ncbi:MAG TPA: hypothetical protein VLH86_03865 [Patescibacteria group bacterium]|nr:hypothetical protein [Patescibacteria group bacterium]
MVPARRTTISKSRYLGLGLGLLLLLIGVSSLSVEGASSIAQGFKTTDPNIVAGALVGLESNNPNTVELTNSNNIDHLVGVAGDKSLIELSNGSAGVQVVTSGITATFVSDINGSVKTGDKITASPIAGVGMKATTSTVVIGTAQADLSSVKTEARTVTDKGGAKKAVQIAAIPVQVDKVFYQAPQDQSSFLPPAFQDFANSVAGHQVSPVRVLVAALLVLFLFATVTILLYSAVRSSIISIGRNPLSENAVRKSLVEVGLTVVGVLAFTVIVIYLILTL